jgi:hypothetical protein
MTTTTTPVTIAAAAARAGMKMWPIYKLTETGRLPYVTLPGHRARIVALEDVRVLLPESA